MATSWVSTTPAFAQSESVSDDGNIIVVTARKQEESLQEVPVAVSVIGGDTLEGYRIDEAADILSRVPALNVQIGGSGAGAQISLRGVGSSNISNAFDSAVALNIDGVSVSTQRLLQSAFFDVAQIEVLKGPQSLYFGKAASAGVFSLRSADPTPDWEFGGKASYEFEESGYTVGGYISGPVSDTLGIRLAAEYQDIDKYVELQSNVPALDRDKGLTNFIGRLTLDWEPTDNFNANLKLNYNRQRGESLLQFSDIFCGGDGLPDPSVLGVFGVSFAPTHNCNIGDNRFPTPDGNAAINVVPTGTVGADRDDISQAFNDTDLFFARLSFDVGLGENLTLSSVTGYIDMENEYNDSFNSTGQLPDGSAAGLVAPFRNTLQQYTQELRLTSDYAGPFNFMIGAFWESRDIGLSTSQNAFNPSLVLGPDPVTGFTFDWFADRPIKSEALSLFGSATFDFDDQWQLSGGVRWTDEQKKTTVAFPYVHSFITTAFGAVGSGFFAGPVRFDDSNISPEVVLRYKASDDVNIYAAFKTGFKSGGVDNNILPTGAIVPGLNSPDPAVVEASGDALRFNSETSIGGELGVKSQFADRTVTLNATAYYYVFDDLQVQNFDVAIFNFDTTNAGELTTLGVDVEWAWATPVDGLRFSGAVSWLDAEFTDTFLVPTSGDDLNGRRPARAPKFSGNIAMDLKVPVGDALQFGLSANAAYSGSYITANSTLQTFNDAVRNANGALNNLVQDDYVTLDAALSVGDPDGKWTLSVIGNNLTDEIFINTAGPAPFVGPGDDQIVTLNRGRQIFVEAAFKF
ncbi:TonB-dependent receptor [Parasphingorhabdus litoris]|uniref:TonB-dependent receptor n=1 Tax=Parasphingorhabdus litoris TaxID=394733 RepID=A0ABP3K501_9SPHN